MCTILLSQLVELLLFLFVQTFVHFLFAIKENIKRQTIYYVDAHWFT